MCQGSGAEEENSQLKIFVDLCLLCNFCVFQLIGNCVVAQSVLPRPRLNEMIGVNVGFGLAIAFGVAISAKISGLYRELHMYNCLQLFAHEVPAWTDQENSIEIHSSAKTTIY